MTRMTGKASFTSSRPQTASIDENAPVTGHAPGKNLNIASIGGKVVSRQLVTNEDAVKAPKREMRSAWIATVDNIDWPAKLSPEEIGVIDPEQLAERQKADYIQILDDLKSLGINAIIMQIKPTADSFYPSEYGPWSEWLSGVQGRDPGYDPLQFMIEEAQKRNLEFHAWFNPYRISIHSDINRLSAEHPLKKHQDWMVTYGGRLLLDPGIPEAQEYIINSVMEVVSKYDIDAVQFDDYFYPYPANESDFPDQQTYETYGKDRFNNIADWRRDNVNTFIRKLAAEIKKEKPYVKFGISPFGIWRNKSSDPTGSDTNGLQNYDALYADTRKWIEEAWVDYMTPQNYWHFGNESAAYEVVLDWWIKELRERGSNTHLYIGQASYRIGSPSENPAWMNPDELPDQLKFNRRYEEVKGSMFFNTSSLQANRLGFSERLKKEIYATPALIPAMDWLPKMVHQPPTLVRTDNLAEGIRLTWEDHAGNESAYYVIYRAAKGQVLTIEDPGLILSIVRPMSAEEPLTFIDSDV
ncbi:glycoside hydrolase family 10 protein, partial [Paenibacillus senegalensis]|uniref:glycoside hydrolase family 10 protein n=1 Tax=Paenibacillus senegalensis TaxID=1465766 RepID=UPI001F1D2063